MSKNFDEIKDYCMDKDYFISVYENNDGKSCFAVFPQSSIYKEPISASQVIYEITNTGISYISHNIDEEDVYASDANIDCPEYARRLVVFHDIIVKAARLRISPKLIIFFDSDGKEIDEGNFNTILNSPKLQEDIDLEDKLAKVYFEYLEDTSKDLSSLAEEYGVTHGYNMITLPFLRKDFEE